MVFTSEERVNIRAALSAAVDRFDELSQTATGRAAKYFASRAVETRAAILAFDREIYGEKARAVSE